MGLLDLFRRGPETPADRFPLGKQGRVDRGSNRALVELLDVRQGERGADWNARFIELAWLAAVRQPHAMAIQGSDDFPYLRLDIASPGLRPQCLANIAEECLDRGWGIAFYAKPEDPVDQSVYVVSFGRLQSVVEYDSAEGDPNDLSELAREAGECRTDSTDDGGDWWVGDPRPGYLPAYSARALGSYLEDVWELEEPRVLQVIDPQMRPLRGLMIGRKESEFPADLKQTMIEQLFWFLPPGRPILTMPDEMRIEDMVPLRALAGLEPGEDWWP